ncbi:hypothetical protein HMPREF0548_0879 [Lactobacillus ultunensis DSM 16047]|uniref:Uncharacterized protein n=1 Tax=Lactobacillus ultunensis DSM 16047 TaxID=525365 RepID=C2EMI3_9LACO|nr:hypothetical protein HMPREF0548_0879 [Lactobacillus ultunensis DSM 16047]
MKFHLKNIFKSKFFGLLIFWILLLIWMLYVNDKWGIRISVVWIIVIVIYLIKDLYQKRK